MKKVSPLITLVVILILSLNASAKDRPGAAAVLEMKDGRTTGGELFAVKANEVIIVDAHGDSTAVPWSDVRRVYLSKRTRGAVKTGAILGGSLTVVSVFAMIQADSHGSIETPKVGELAFISVLTMAGAAAGGLFGGMVGRTEWRRTFEIEGLSGASLETTFSAMRKHARARYLL